MLLIKQLITKHREIIDYLFWGFLTTVVSWGSYAIFSLAFDSILKDTVTLSVLLANVLSWICATAFAFVTNKIWVFRSRNWDMVITIPELMKFVSTRLVTGVMEMVAVPFLVSIGLNQTVFGIEGMISKVIVSIVVVILNYIVSKIFIFKKK